MSLHMQPSLPSGSNQVDKEWKDTIRAAKKSIEQHKRIHRQEEAEVGPSEPTQKGNPISPDPTGLTTPGSQGADKVSRHDPLHDHLIPHVSHSSISLSFPLYTFKKCSSQDGDTRLLTSTRRILETESGIQGGRARLERPTAHLKAELENALLDAETREEVHKSLLTQLEAKEMENKALEDLITSLNKSRNASRSETEAWEKRKNAMDGEMKTLLKDIAAVRRKSAEAAKEAFDKGYAQGLQSVNSFEI